MKKTLIILLSALFLITVNEEAVKAGDDTRVGTNAGEGLMIPVGARSIAMAGAVGSDVTGLESIFYNPAGLAASKSNVEFMFSNMSYIANIGVNYFAAGVRAGSVGWLALNIKSIDIGTIQTTTINDPDGLSGATFRPSLIDAGLTISRAMSDKIFFGLTARVVSEKISAETATGYSVDLGLQYKTPVGVNFGIALKNLGGTMSYTGSELEQKLVSQNGTAYNFLLQAEAYQLPTVLEMDLSYATKFDEKNKFVVSGAFVNNNFAADEYKIGAEYGFNNLLFFRGGYSLSAGTSDSYIYGADFGAGINYRLGNLNVQIDYAYQSVKYFSANQVFTVKLGF
jgi:hypothetical protein